jgi:hypothetical protein
VGEVGDLVLVAPAADELGLGVVDHRPAEAPTGGVELQGGETLTGQVTGEVGGAEHEAAVDEFHDSDYGGGV